MMILGVLLLCSAILAYGVFEFGWDLGAIGVLVSEVFGNWENLGFWLLMGGMLMLVFGLFVVPNFETNKFEKHGKKAVGTITKLKDTGARSLERPILDLQISVSMRDGSEELKVAMKTVEILDAHLYKVGSKVDLLYLEGRRDVKVIGINKG